MHGIQIILAVIIIIIIIMVKTVTRFSLIAIVLQMDMIHLHKCIVKFTSGCNTPHKNDDDFQRFWLHKYQFVFFSGPHKISMPNGPTNCTYNVSVSHSLSFAVIVCSFRNILKCSVWWLLHCFCTGYSNHLLYCFKILLLLKAKLNGPQQLNSRNAQTQMYVYIFISSAAVAHTAQKRSSRFFFSFSINIIFENLFSHFSDVWTDSLLG